MTRIELENRVWLLANHEEKNELLDLGLTSKARYAKRVLELGNVGSIDMRVMKYDPGATRRNRQLAS